METRVLYVVETKDGVLSATSKLRLLEMMMKEGIRGKIIEQTFRPINWERWLQGGKP